MKNVRLFAVAAALGMFASTVAAAETTSKTTVKWTGADTIIKVDLGEEVVVPTLSATATTTTTSEKCANGTDANNDGLVDTGVYTVDPTVNADQGWLYTNAKYWATNDPAKKTPMYYLGLANGADFYGARFLKPGSEEIDEDVFVDQLSHKRYTSEEDAFNALAEKGIITVNYDADGNIDTVIVDYRETYFPFTTQLNYATYLKVTSLKARKSDVNIIEAVVDYVVSGKALNNQAGLYTVDSMTTDSVKTKTDYTVTVKEGNNSFDLPVVDNYNDETVYGPIVLVQQTRKGDYYLVDLDDDSSFDYDYNEPRTVYNAVRPTATISSGANVFFTQYGYEASATTLSTADSAAKPTASTPKGTILVKNSDGTYLTATSGDLAANYKAVWNGEKAVTTVYKTKTYVAGKEVTIHNISDSADYIATNSDIKYSAINTSNVTYLTAAASAAINATLVDDTYRIADSSETYKALALVSKDNAGEISLSIVDYKSADIKVLDGGKYVTVDATNASKYMNSTYINDLGTTVNGKLLSQYKDATTENFTYGNVTGWEPLAAHKYEFVEYAYTNLQSDNGLAYDQYYWKPVKAYNKSTKALCENFAVSKYAGVYSHTTQLFEAKTTTNPNWNQITRYGKDGYVTVVDVTDADFTAPGASYGQGASVVASFEVKQLETYALENNYELVIDGDIISLNVVNKEVSGETAPFVANANRYGWYELTEIPANNTDYYVMLTDRAGLDLSSIWSYSASKETGLLRTAAGEDIECKAVQLEKKGNYYPAFETEEELIKAVYAITGLDTALVGTAKDSTKTTFKNWYDSVINATKTGIANLEFTDANAKSLFEELPTSGVGAVHGAEKCTYESTTEPKEVEVTYDASAVDTSKAGIYDITYTADVAEGAEDRIATVKVVVAPKYVRTWGANGKVATLTSFYVSNPEAKYAHYVYDWSAKKVTVTYYNVDGSVASTAVNSL